MFASTIGNNIIVFGAASFVSVKRNALYGSLVTTRVLRCVYKDRFPKRSESDNLWAYSRIQVNDKRPITTMVNHSVSWWYTRYIPHGSVAKHARNNAGYRVCRVVRPLTIFVIPLVLIVDYSVWISILVLFDKSIYSIKLDKNRFILQLYFVSYLIDPSSPLWDYRL